ncbi:MAG: hypothetical protein ACR2N4_15975 [Jatrophihabitans sp.]
MLYRFKLPSVLLRLQHDQQLKDADLSGVAAANLAGQLVFTASSGLSDGVTLLDPYLGPLFGCLSPFIWAVPATRASGVVVYALGMAMSGVLPYAAEPLQILPSHGARDSTPRPDLSPPASGKAIAWWAKHLGKTLSVVSDPAVFSDAEGNYLAVRHMHATLSIEQVFRPTASIQQAHRDTHARRVLLFNVLDTFERVTSRSLIEMCTLSTATAVLNKLRKQLPPQASEVLLPAADRAVRALLALQHGFYLAKQMQSSTVEFEDSDGNPLKLSLEAAAAEYVRVLRNATHGHGSNREEKVHQTDALLAQHDGTLPHDLGLLAYLYLLDLMARPQTLQAHLHQSVRRAEAKAARSS